MLDFRSVCLFGWLLMCCRKCRCNCVSNHDLNHKYKKMTEFSIANQRYGYLHERKWPSEAIDMHHVVVRKSNGKGFFVFFSALIALANASYLFLVKVKD